VEIKVIEQSDNQQWFPARFLKQNVGFFRDTAKDFSGA
jgi:hypothetical protein